MDRRTFLKVIPAPLAISRDHVRPQELSPPRVIWVQMTWSTDAREIQGKPTVDELCAAQIVRGRRILAVLREAREFARIVVSQDCSSDEHAQAFLRTMLAEVDTDTGEQNYGAIEAAIAISANESVDVLAFLGSHRALRVANHSASAHYRLDRIEKRLRLLEEAPPVEVCNLGIDCEKQIGEIGPRSPRVVNAWLERHKDGVKAVLGVDDVKAAAQEIKTLCQPP